MEAEATAQRITAIEARAVAGLTQIQQLVLELAS